MSGVLKKTEIGPINGTPEKRMFWSIISDYDLKTGLCELIDNALDIWLRKGDLKNPPTIDVLLDVERQIISVKDNVGGVKFEDLHLLLAPGGSQNDPDAEMIGIFGVGGKRAGIALGEHVEIRTRYRGDRSLQLDITADWLSSNDWELNGYEIPDIDKGTTTVEISKLRQPFVSTNIGDLRGHVGEVYSWYIENGCKIRINGREIDPAVFDNWSYPPGHSPRRAEFVIDLGQQGKVKAEIVAGLIRDRDPDSDNYGGYFYCNNRLIVKELKSREVGYMSGLAGVPHPDASLCRGIVRLNGPAKLMPWTSAKNGINSSHVIFEHVRSTLVPLMTHFSTLSRRMKGDWDNGVFKYQDGAVEPVEPVPSGASLRANLPPLPKAKKASFEKLKAVNRKQIDEMPWTLGLVEAMGALEVIERQNLETRNRIALILLDSNFEIALKEFIVHRTDLFAPHKYPDSRIAQIFSQRHAVINEIKGKISIPDDLLARARHYYGLRNKLIHERATVDVADRDIKNYRSVVGRILKILFGLKFPNS